MGKKNGGNLVQRIYRAEVNGVVGGVGVDLKVDDLRKVEVV